MHRLKPTPEFDHDIATLQAENQDLEPLRYVIRLLADGKKLNRQYNDHSLRTRFTGLRECHIEDDWLLIYKIEKSVLHLIATGTHAELFDR